MNSGADILTALFMLAVVVAVLAGIFLMLRALVLWYWRVNEAVELLQAINKKLGRMLDNAPAQGQAAPGDAGGAARLGGDGL